MVRTGLVILVLGLAVSLPTTEAIADPVITRVSVAERGDGLGFVMRLHADSKVPAFSLPEADGDGVYAMSLFKTGVNGVLSNDNPPQPLKSFSFEKVGDELTFRFAIASGNFIVTAYHDRDSPDILVGLERTNSPVVAQPLPVRPATAVSQGDRWLLDTIVIDAGHGGKDPGNIKGSRSARVREKDITLPVALKLGAYLEERLGVNVVYTRTDDRFIDLKVRGEIANAAKGKLFISIHANAFQRVSVGGTETYILGLHKTESARRVMEAENSVVLKYEDNPDAYAHMTEEALVRMALAQSAYLKQSEEIASLIEEQFATRVGRHSRGVKQAGFQVLWAASMPAILVELGYLSNKADRRFLTSEQGQDYMASAIFRAIRDYKLKYEQNLTHIRSVDE